MKNNEHKKSLSLRSVFQLCLRHFTLAILATVVLSGCGSGGGGEGGSAGNSSSASPSNVTSAAVTLETGVVVFDSSTTGLVLASDTSSVTFMGAPGAVV